MFSLTVMEDRSQFDGADRLTIRQHFLEWRAKAPAEEQTDPKDENDEDVSAITAAKAGLSPRYRSPFKWMQLPCARWCMTHQALKSELPQRWDGSTAH